MRREASWAMLGTRQLYWGWMMRRMRGVLGVILVVVATQMAGATAAHAAYPGSNGLIAFVRAGDIWTISPSSRVQRRLTFIANNGTPVWSPSGKLIAFTSSRAGSADIWVMNANGTSPHRITTATTIEESPTWSPDGKWLAFSTKRGTTHEFAIFKIRSTIPYGSAIRLTTPPPPLDQYDVYTDYDPSWSPLGGNILFVRQSPCGDPSCADLYRVSSNGGVLTQVITEDAWGSRVGNNWAPDYAPRGRAIAFTSDIDSLPYQLGPINIYISQSNGSNAHDLTNNVDFENPVFNDSAAWAPSGTLLTYSRQACPGYVCGSTDVWTIHSDGTVARLLVRNASDPNWQPIP
jgi:Tol biopolymer transport system component